MVGERIRKLRKQKKLNQNGLAKAIGATQTLISLWENKGVFPQKRYLKKLSEVFDVPPESLLYESEEKKGVFVEQEMVLAAVPVGSVIFTPSQIDDIKNKGIDLLKLFEGLQDGGLLMDKLGESLKEKNERK